MGIEVYAGGTDVVTIVGKMPGKVTASVIRFTIVSYEITYFDGSEFKTVWMNELEFTTDAEKVGIGFKK